MTKTFVYSVTLEYEGELTLNHDDKDNSYSSLNPIAEKALRDRYKVITDNTGIKLNINYITMK